MTPIALRQFLPAVITATALIALSACAGTPDVPLSTSDTERRVVTVAQASAASDVVSATDRFGLAMLASAPGEQNAVVSPASAVIALSMLAEGARGDTAKQFDAVLGASGGARTDAVNALLAALEVYGGDPAIVQEGELPEKPLLHVASQVVLDHGFTALPEFLDSLASGYGAGVLATDLSGSEGKKVLDAWVKENTGGLIKKSAIEPNDDLRLVLQNAVVLAAPWDSPFEEDATGPQTFTLGTGEQVDTDMMNQVGQFRYSEAEGWQSVRLPYSEGLHADIVLPPKGTDPTSITPELKTELSAQLDAAQPVTVNLAVPSLDIEGATLDLSEPLETAGLGDLFVQPDLSGISGGDLVLDQAMQQAVLTVDEAGTIAAAVTELGVGEASAPLPADEIRFQADHPYLLSISHTETSWPLFVAAIRDPRH